MKKTSLRITLSQLGNGRMNHWHEVGWGSSQTSFKALETPDDNKLCGPAVKGSEAEKPLFNRN